MQTHTRYSNETRENLDHYLSKAGIHMYAKNAGSSEGAVWETPEYTATLRLTDLTRTNPIDYALFEYYPGIMVRVSKSDKDNIDIPCYKNVAAYCAEFIKPTYGAMEVSREHRDVYFKFELPVTGRHQIDALFCGEYSLGGVYRLLVHGFCKDVRDRVFHIIRGLEPKRHCEVRLRIEIDRQYRISLPHKSGTEVHGGGGLSDTTFLVRYRDYFGHGVPPY